MNLKYEVGQEVITNVRVTETISSIEINLRGATYHTQSGKTYPEMVLASIENKPTRSAVQEDKPKEPIVLYCILKDDGWCNFEKGKTYKADDSRIYEGTRNTNYNKNSDWVKKHFIKTEKRPAKLGEYVLITNACEFLKRYKNGDIFKVTRKWGIGIDVGKKFDIFDNEYLVLPDYQPKKVEPTYLNMKVVCVDNSRHGGNSGCASFFQGKTYEVKDGFLTDEHGSQRPMQKEEAFHSFEELESFYHHSFRKYGEQSC